MRSTARCLMHGLNPSCSTSALPQRIHCTTAAVRRNSAHSMMRIAEARVRSLRSSIAAVAQQPCGGSPREVTEEQCRGEERREPPLEQPRSIESWRVTTLSPQLMSTPGADSHGQTARMSNGVKQHFEYPAFISACRQPLLRFARRCLAHAVDRLLFGAWAQLQLLHTTVQSARRQKRRKTEEAEAEDDDASDEEAAEE